MLRRIELMPEWDGRKISERSGLNVDGIFPLSLKNLLRIQIKNSMTDYSVKNVRKLTILPKVLQDFVLFEEENQACFMRQSSN